MKYQEYLQSDEWKIKRQLALQQAGGRCRICNDSEKLHVHHRSYKRKGTPEEVLDLVVLCAECHDWFHKRQDILGEIEELRSEVNASAGWEFDDYENTILKAEHIILLRALAFLGLESSLELIDRAALMFGVSQTQLKATSVYPDIFEHHCTLFGEYKEEYSYTRKSISKAMDYIQDTVKEIEACDHARRSNG